MSDLRLQNLLQSMRQNVVISKDNLKLSAVNFTVQPPQFPDVIQNFLNAQVEILQAKQNFDLKNAVLAQLRVVDVSANQKDKVDIQLAFKGEVFTISLKASEVPQDVIHGGQRLALNVVAADTAKQQYNLILIDDHVTPKTYVSSQTVAESQEVEMPLNTPPLRDDDFAHMVGRLKKLEDIEQKIDALREVIPRSPENMKSVLRSFSIDLMARQDVIVPPDIEPQILPIQITKALIALPQDYTVKLSVPATQQILTSFVFEENDDASKAADSPVQKNTPHIVLTQSPAQQSVEPAVPVAQLVPVVNGDADVATFLPKAMPPIDAPPRHAAQPVVYDAQRAPNIRDMMGQDIRSPEIVVVDEGRSDKTARYNAENPFTSSIKVIDERALNATQLMNGQAAGINVRVIGETQKGEKIVQPDWPNWPAHKALVFGLKDPRDIARFHAIETGDIIPVELPQVSDDVDAPIHRSAERDAVQAQWPKSLSPFMASANMANGFAQLFNGDLQSFTAALASSPAVLANQMMVPNIAKPAEMPAALLFLVAALRSGDVAQMFDGKMDERFAKLGRLDVLRSFLKDTADGSDILSRQEQGRSATEWRSLMMPMLNDGQISAIALHWSQHGGGQGQGGEGEDAPKRFVLDFSLNAMGDVQLDGLFQDKRLNIALRLEKLPSDAMAARIREFYYDALDQVGLSGDLRFQTMRPHAVSFVPESDVGLHADRLE